MQTNRFRWPWTVLGLALVLVSPLCLKAEEQPSENFLQALQPMTFRFPQDLGSHPRYRTEWWYLTGALKSAEGDVFGFQATWFRIGLKADLTQRPSTLAANHVILFNGALTDVTQKKFIYDHAVSRSASTWAGADPDKLKVYLLGRTLKQDEDGVWHLKFHVKNQAFDLRLDPQGDALPHGKQPGLSRKGPEPGQASHYFSFTRMKTAGTLQRVPDGPAIKVSGSTWFDKEFGSNQLDSGVQIGWDWFSVALDDGTDLMLYQLRRTDGSIEPASSGTLRFSTGQRVHLERKDYQMEVLGQWQSPRSEKAQYPAQWRIKIPSQQIELLVTPLLADQELETTGSTNVNYWEGLCSFNGQVGSRKVCGQGYVELVGYNGKFLGSL